MSLRGYSMPDEVYFLCLLHNVGATSSDRSLTLEEISKWTATDLEKVRENLEKLVSNDYVSMRFDRGAARYHVTINGIRKVLTMYS